MKAPNLFIVGAPKCGTTAVFNALARHSRVCPSNEKEPHYYSTDVYRHSRPSKNDYLALFDREQSASAFWLMDGSTRYLYSQVAIDTIEQENPSAKFIALLRNPADMLYSLHNHLYFLGVETESDFATAWRRSFVLDRNELISAGCNDPDSLDYPKIGRLGEQISRLNRKVFSSKRLVILYDDIVRNPHATISQVLDFLDLERQPDVAISKDNRSMMRKSRSLFYATSFIGSIKKRIGMTSGFGILNYVNSINRKERKSNNCDTETRQSILKYFHDDLRLLEKEVGRDLSDWRVNVRER